MENKSIRFSIAALLLLIFYMLVDFGVIPWFHFSKDRAQIGQIVKIDNSVQFKENENLYWLSAQDKQGLNYYDSILTLNESSTRIQLKDGTLIELSAETLIVLEPPDSGQDLKLVVIRGNAHVVSGNADLVAIENRPQTPRYIASLPDVVEIPVIAPVGEVEIPPAPTVEEEAEPSIPQIIKKGFSKIKRVLASQDHDVIFNQVPRMKAPIDKKPGPEVPTYWWLWLGVGANYLSYAQTIANFTDASYQSLKGPSIYLRTGRRFDFGYGIDLTYKDSPGSVASSPSIQVINGEYSWRTITGEGFKKLNKDSSSFLGRDFAFNLRAGVQQHYVPFIAAQESGAADIRQNSLTMVSGGFDFISGQKRRFRYELQGRYQYPIGTGASGSNRFSIKPSFAFDGSAGVVYKISSPWSLGAHWYGQWHQYQFDYFDSDQGVMNTGAQSLFYSNAELRLGYEF